MSSELKVCEFYSGIGGYHIALSLLKHLPFRVVGAFEISSNANLVYRHNFPETPVFETNLCGLTAARLDTLTRDITMTTRDKPGNPRNAAARDAASHDAAARDATARDATARDATAHDAAAHNAAARDATARDATARDAAAHDATARDAAAHDAAAHDATAHDAAARYPDSNSTLFVMSPPCQPFTRQGAQKDDQDARSESVLHLFSMFSELAALPGYFLLENVKGFEASNTRDRVMEFFTRHGYHTREYLLNSNQFGIPNSRLRYYLLARMGPFVGEAPCEGLLTTLPVGETLLSKPLSQYLEKDPEGFEISDKFLSKWGRLLDIVTSHSSRSCCFTKGYSVKAEGSGSVLQQRNIEDSAPRDVTMTTPRDVTIATPRDENTCDNSRSAQHVELTGEEFVAHMKSLDLRYFTPREIARLHGIPESYTFPESLTNKQRYKLLGNGLNVTVVGLLLEVLLKEG